MNVLALHDYFERTAALPFEFGRLDCVRFAVEALHEGFGRDYRADLMYHDRRSAVARLRAADGLRDAIGASLGRELRPEELEPGDLAWFDWEPATIGLVLDDYVAVKAGRTIHRVHPSAILFGWRT